MDDKRRYCPYCHIPMRRTKQSQWGYLCPECGEDTSIEGTCNFAENVELQIVWGTQATLEYLEELRITDQVEADREAERSRKIESERTRLDAQTYQLKLF